MTPMQLTSDVVLATLGDTGKPVVDSTTLDAGIAGAVLLDLVHAGALRVEAREGKKPRLRATGDAVPADPDWRDALQRADGRKPKDAVARIGGASTFKDRAGRLRADVLERLEAEGQVTRTQAKVLGLVARDRWLVEAAVRARLVDRLESALTEGAQPRPEDAALVAVLHGMGALPKVLPGRDRRWLKARGRAVSEGDWGSKAVADAIQDVYGAVAAGVAVAAAAAVGGSV